MCLIVFRLQPGTAMPLIVAANRDEYHHRPTRALQFWTQYPYLLAGQDLEQGGTWLGLSLKGRFAALTNYREPIITKTKNGPSRGHLVHDYLTSALSVPKWVAQYGLPWEDFDGFNAVLMDQSGAWYISNKASQLLTPLEPGLYGLSNHLLNSPWPKAERCKQQVATALQNTPNVDILLSLLQDSWQPQDNELPDTGVGLVNERRLAPIFIRGKDYGTRCSSVLMVRSDGKTEFSEQGYASSGELQKRHNYQIKLPTDTGLVCL